MHKRRTELSLLTLRWWSHESQAISTATSETLDRPCQEEIPPQSRPGPNRKSPPPTFCRVVVGGKSKMLTQGSANTRGEPSCHYKPCRKSHKPAALHDKLDLSPCACATQQRATAQTAQDKPCCNAHTSHLDTCTHAPRGEYCWLTCNNVYFSWVPLTTALYTTRLGSPPPPILKVIWEYWVISLNKSPF